MKEWIVLRRNGAGWEELPRVEAGTPLQAIEKAADGEGEYIASTAGAVRTVKVQQAFRVVGDGRRRS